MLQHREPAVTAAMVMPVFVLLLIKDLRDGKIEVDYDEVPIVKVKQVYC